MIYIYDILLNFCDNDLIYDFYEWSSDDSVDNIKRIKLVHVDRNIYDKILKYNFEVDDEFLIKIFKTCEVYNKKKVDILDYCCLFSDGSRVLAIEFNSNGDAMYKSKLLIDEEDEIATLASNLEVFDINIKIKTKILNVRFNTRDEIKIKKFLINEINNAYKNKKYAKLRYLYQEYFEKNVDSYKKMRDELINSVSDMIDNKHRAIYELLKLTIKKENV